MPERILVVDDDDSFRRMLCEAISEKGYEVDHASSAEEAIPLLRIKSFGVMLLDVMLPGMSGIEAIPKLLEADPRVDIIVMTAFSAKDSALEAIRRGAYDFFPKPFSLGEMEIVIRRALEKRRLQSQIKALQESMQRESPSKMIVGQSECMKRLKAVVERVARLETNVLITGESGTGKEIVADTIHALSPRAKGPFIKINCAALPETLLESELFGHEKGAFTGASAGKKGKFELAEHGTILLDEIGDMPLHLQPKLLRAVEQKQVERIGGSKPITYDVKIIAATNQDLAGLIQEKKFREDLYYRLNVATIHIPPLRERKEDLPLLVDHFVRGINLKTGTDIATVSSDAMEALFRHDWPGNVRQLRNILERASIFCKSNVMTTRDIELALQRGPIQLPDSEPSPTLSLREQLQEMEKSLILNALQRANGVQIEAAKLLGISPKNLWNKIQKHHIDPSSCHREQRADH